MLTDIFVTGIQQGLLLALVTYAVMIPFRCLNLPDLSAEGAYPLGGAIAAACLLLGGSGGLAIVLAMLGAGCMGIATGLIHIWLRINSLLAGIILSTMAYSVNLRLLQKPNVALFDVRTLFSSGDMLSHIGILLMVVMACVGLFTLFLQTEAGIRLRAVGLNPGFARSQGIPVSRYLLFGMFLAGCLSGLAGSLMTSLQQYMDVGMGIGIVIHALAALMIGEALLGNQTVVRQLASPLVGALVYQQIQGIVLALGLPPTDLKLFTGAVVLTVLGLKRQEAMLPYTQIN